MQKHKNIVFRILALAGVSLLMASCQIPRYAERKEDKSVPSQYNSVQTDSSNTAVKSWKLFFTDPNLVQLIDSALANNQELKILEQEILAANAEARGRKGAYMPSVDLGGGAGIEKPGRFTQAGASKASSTIEDGKKVPDPLPNFMVGARASWEIDIWRKLRNARQSAVHRYLASVEGKNFVQTLLISEIAQTYYELVAYDNQLDILRKNIAIQQNALEIVRLEKTAARVTELAVRKFEAEVLKNQSHQYAILQKITEAENRLNFLAGRFPGSIPRSRVVYTEIKPDSVSSGLPVQILENRPDIRQAEQLLTAARLDVKVARAAFYPSLTLDASLGLSAYQPGLLTSPESAMYGLGGSLVGPLLNRYGLKADLAIAQSKQGMAILEYERRIRRAVGEVSTQIANVKNLSNSYALKEKQVQALYESIDISTVLFRSARADYMEVLMTQRDAECTVLN